ncbi:hypothetical protein NK6_3091 [Bradyrhizobium diazoefficiens]|uniref:Uncharacterized protein n=1 Tax=Bradyrhizobium diazoefficiens TaxID=1355477 RepID=A0A0E4BMY2_9BRAD|nr:hypothetical protein NK6_3091 [Bradyrhizobium diazoefficiens]
MTDRPRHGVLSFTVDSHESGGSTLGRPALAALILSKAAMLRSDP